MATNFMMSRTNSGRHRSTPSQEIRDTYGKLGNKTILFTNARDETHLTEWAVHHLLLGFDYVYIFDHKSKQPINTTINVPKEFAKRVVVQRCELDNPVKIPLMKQAVAISKQAGADWLLYLDADEFLILNKYRSVKHLLYVFSHADSLAINWLMFGTNNHIKEPEGLILENYTKSEPKLDRHVKSFVRPQEVTNVTNPHFFNIYRPVRMRTIDNKSMGNSNNLAFNPSNMTYAEAPAYVAHYVNQSEESYIKRKLRLPTDDVGTYRKRDFKLHEHYNVVENTQPRDKYAEGCKKFLLTPAAESA